MNISELSDEDLHVLWSAMQAMVNDIHAPQDCLNEALWERAEHLMAEMDVEVNQRVFEKRKVEGS